MPGHFLGDESIGGVAGGLGAEFAEPLEGAEVDLKVPVDIISHRDDVLGFLWKFRSDGVIGLFGSFHGFMVIFFHVSTMDFWGGVIPVISGEPLSFLSEDPMAVQVAVNSEVSKDFKGETRVF